MRTNNQTADIFHSSHTHKSPLQFTAPAGLGAASYFLPCLFLKKSQMGSFGNDRLHAVCIPFPAQGHITPMLTLAKLLHWKGFHITFVNTEHNHRRLLRSHGAQALDGLPDFQFESIPDGLPPSGADATQHVPSLCLSTSSNCSAPFRELLKKLNQTPNVPRVSCVVSDGIMSFTLDAAEELQVPEVLFWTPSACGFMSYVHYPQLIERGIIPLKDESQLTNGYLDTTVDWIPGMKEIRLRDLPRSVQTRDPQDIILDFVIREIKRLPRASAIILNTFYELDHEVLDAMASISPPLYSIGPVSLLTEQIQNSELKSIGSNLWKEDGRCLKWLDTKEPCSVVYVNFGSITVLSPQQLMEVAHGLANSDQHFLWIIRPDLVAGEAAVLLKEFSDAIREKGLLSSWVPQQKVLSHPSVGGFFTHCGWNSTLESISHGIPMVCWPFFSEQLTNCWFARKLGIGIEMSSHLKRDEVKELVRELMEGDKGKEMRKKALKWQAAAVKAAKEGGSSYENLDRLVKEVLHS